MSFFKLVMIALLKIYAASKIFDKIFLKAIIDTFFSNMWSEIRRGTAGLNFLVGVISNRREKFKLLGLQGNTASILSLRGAS